MSGINFDYTYTVRNQLESVTNPNGVTISFGYDNGGRRTSVSRTGSVILYGYNNRDWITSVRNRAGTEDEIIRYDAYYYYQDGSLWDHTGNPVKRVENFGGNDFTTTLRYDNVYRQIEETKRDYLGATVYSLTYGYDQVGNRTSMTRDGISYTYVYDDNNKLSTVTSGGNTASFSYDLNGNLTNVDGLLYPTRTMTYNDENRLSSVTFNGYTDTYTYNWQGLRTRATLNGVTYRYIYNGERVLEELNDSGGVLARYTTENDSYYGTLLHLQRYTGESRFPIYDEIGSARGLIDAAGTVTDSYDMDTFGKPIQTTGTTPNPYRYGAAWGYITDPNGFLQLGARYYWPEVGRFVSQDPVRDGINWYVYAGENPLSGIDPRGLACGQIGGTAPLGFGLMGTAGANIGCVPDPNPEAPCHEKTGKGCKPKKKGLIGRALRKVIQCFHPYVGVGVGAGQSLSGSVTPSDCSGGTSAWAGVSMVNAGVAASYGVSSSGGWGGTWGGGVGDSVFAGIVISLW